MFKISVIIPVYNTEKYLVECLESVLQQTFSNYEVICVNDASTDASPIILNEYRNKFDHISIINHRENRGLSVARNTGMQYARGKYIMFLDSDDMLKPATMETLYTVAEANRVEIIYFNCEVFYEQEFGKRQGFFVAPHQNFHDIYTGQQLLCKYKEVNSVNYSAACKFYLKDFIDTNNLYFYENILHEDVLYSFHCFMKAKRVMCLDDAFYLCRKRLNSITNTIDNRRAESWFFVSMEIYKYWANYLFDKQTDLSIAWYFEKAFHAYLHYSRYCDENTHLPYGRAADQKLYELIVNKKATIYCYLSVEKLERLHGQPIVIVYGAGAAANEVLDILSENDIRVKAVAVSSKIGNVNKLGNIEVKEIQDLTEYREVATVVVAVTEKWVQEIKNTLVEYGFNDIMEVDYI